VFDLTDLELDGVEPVDDDLTLSSVRTIAGLHLRNAKAGSRSCSCYSCICWCQSTCSYCNCHEQPEPAGKN
jgi:coproporphyrinogen III oxidase-like Fe-S oxidoreductase